MVAYRFSSHICRDQKWKKNTTGNSKNGFRWLRRGQGGGGKRVSGQIRFGLDIGPSETLVFHRFGKSYYTQ